MKTKSTKKILNKKAFHDYSILEKTEAGIELKGSEVKSIRAGQANLKGAYVKFSPDEAWIAGMHISLYSHSTVDTAEPLRPRRLLLHKREITNLYNKIREKNLTVVPLSLYFKRGFAKLEIALVKGRKLYDKREVLKKKTILKELKIKQY